jgi:hypothetical protein
MKLKYLHIKFFKKNSLWLTYRYIFPFHGCVGVESLPKAGGNLPELQEAAR